MAITKLMMYDNRPDVAGETTIYPVGGSQSGLVKVAGSIHPDTMQALADLPDPRDGYVRALITALSKFEPFGPNKNGDGFYESALTRANDYGDVDGENLTLPMYKSFERFAKPFKNHDNTDKSPSYGHVLSSTDNDAMGRIELIVEVARTLAPDIVRAIENYEPVSTSMGFRAKYDVCSVCSNQARTRRDYCDHLRRLMLHVLPNGHQVHARNPWGKFFDISFVADPADVTSRAVAVGRLPHDMTKSASRTPAGLYVPETLVYLSSDLAKVAGYADVEPEALTPLQQIDGLFPAYLAEEQEKAAERAKQADSRKSADVLKRIGGTAQTVLSPADTERLADAVRAYEGARPGLSKEAMNALADTGSAETAFSTALFCGIHPTAPETQYIALRAEGLPKTAVRLAKSGLLLVPDEGDETMASGYQLGLGHVCHKTAALLTDATDLMNDRSLNYGWTLGRTKTARREQNPYLRGRAQVAALRADDLADHRELERARQAVQNPKVLAYVLAMILGSRWGADERLTRQLVAKHPETAARAMGAGTVHDVRNLDHLVPRRAEDPDLHTRVMMTAPVSHYIHGTGVDRNIYAPLDLYGAGGIGAVALGADAKLAAYAGRVVERALAHPLAARALPDGPFDKEAALFYGADAVNASYFRDALDA